MSQRPSSRMRVSLGQGITEMPYGSFREQAMGTDADGYLIGTRVRCRTLWSVCSALIVVALLCTSVVDGAKAATPGPTKVNRTVPKVSPPTELTFSSPPTDAEFLRTGL